MTMGLTTPVRRRESEMISRKRAHLTLHVFEAADPEDHTSSYEQEIRTLADADFGETGVLLIPMLWDMRRNPRKAHSRYFHLDIDRGGSVWIDQRVQLMQEPPRGERAIAARVEGKTVVVEMRREDLVGPGDVRGMKAPTQFGKDGWLRIRFIE